MKPQPIIESTPPKVIFLDAMGTLFGIKGTVGEIYQTLALQHGVKINASSIDKAFIDSFKTAPPLAFRSESESEISQQEFLWWQQVAIRTFTQVGILDQFTNFSAFFSELYTYFATGEPWYIYPDVIPSLKKWQQQGIQLGVVSNFDSRLYKVLKILDLSRFFGSITISSSSGFAKPNPNIFRIALEKHNCISPEAWHIGDSFIEDYQGAKQTGIRAFWLNRSQPSVNNKNQLPNLSSLG